MFTYDCVLAAVLLTAPAAPAPPPESGAAACLEWVRPALVQLALDAEIVDGREDRFRPATPADAAADLKELTGRYAEYLSAPQLEECHWFPPRRLVNDFLTFNRAYRNDLLTRLALDPVHAEELRTAVAETDQLYLIWESLRDARCEYYYVTVRRQALRQLRDLIGMEAFYRGQLPPHVPAWHFPLQR